MVQWSPLFCRKKIIIGVISVLFLSSGIAEAQSASTQTSFQRSCQRLYQSLVQGSSAYLHAQKQVRSQFGMSCEEAAKKEYQEKINFLSKVTSSSNDYQLYREAQALTEALDVFQRLSKSDKRRNAPMLINWGLLHVTFPEEREVRFRYNNNAAKIFAITRDWGTQSQAKQLSVYLERMMLPRYASETQSQFTRRKKAVLDLWRKHGVFVYYWNQSADSSLQDLEKHIEVLAKIEYWYRRNHLPSQESLSLLIIRDDIGATASVGTVFMSSSSSLRTFVHELGHTVHFTNPAVVSSFSDFEKLYNTSGGGQRGVKAGDFASSYHTNHMEDFAELYTEYVLASGSQQYIVDRAIHRQTTGMPVLLKKVFYLMDTVFSQSSRSIAVFGEQDTKRHISVRRSNSTIVGFMWGNNWIFKN